jgi:hypothetical protein
VTQRLLITSCVVVSSLFLSGCAYLTGTAGQQSQSESSFEDNSVNSDFGSSSEPEPQEVTVDSSGAEFMMDALDQLNDSDVNGTWYQDPYTDVSGLSVGVLIDEYSMAPEGCALWWYDSVEDLETHLDQNADFFNEFYWEYWIYNAGPSVLLISGGETDACHISATEILELE